MVRSLRDLKKLRLFLGESVYRCGKDGSFEALQGQPSKSGESLCSPYATFHLKHLALRLERCNMLSKLIDLAMLSRARIIPS